MIDFKKMDDKDFVFVNNNTAVLTPAYGLNTPDGIDITACNLWLSTTCLGRAALIYNQMHPFLQLPQQFQYCRAR